ncbi:hypothetical protein ACEPAH_3734 [Sanghuangporus vaninii]
MSLSTAYRSSFHSFSAPRSPFMVSEPFLQPNGDVILHSADSHKFYVVKAILIIASPFFRSLFSLPQPEDQSNVPTISVSEDSRTLDVLLRFCYPIKNPVVEDLSLAETVLAAALKYEMEIVVQGMCRVLVSEKALDTQPLRVYAIACQHKLAEETRLAAIATLRAAIEDVYVEELEALSAAHYFNLLKFHRRVKAEIYFVLRNASRTAHEFYEYEVEPTRAEPTKEVQSILCRCSDRYSDCRFGGGANWWKYVIQNQVIPAVYRAPLCLELLECPTDSWTRGKWSCGTCKTIINEQWQHAIDSLRNLFNKIASEVAGQMKFQADRSRRNSTLTA